MNLRNRGLAPQPQPNAPGPKAKAQPKPQPKPKAQPGPIRNEDDQRVPVLLVHEDVAIQDEPAQVLQDIFQNLQTPAAVSAQGSPGTMDANMLRRIKLEAYTGTSNITPWLGKLKTLAAINGLGTDENKIAYAHLHLAGRALEWFNDRGALFFSTFADLEEALLKEFGLTEGRRQRYRGDLLTMSQKEKTVQEITELFENTWRLAYTNECQSDTNYKLHNYLRVLESQLASRVGMMNPSSFQAAKDMAYQIEAYMPRGPIARLNTCAANLEPNTEADRVTQLLNAAQQANQAMMSQAVAALSTVQQAMEKTHSTQEDERYRRNREFEDMKHTLGRARPYAPRPAPYTHYRQYEAQASVVPPPPRTGGNTQPMLTRPPRDYSQIICNVCGQKGHTQYYRGCTKHPEYKPNNRVLKNEASRS